MRMAALSAAMVLAAAACSSGPSEEVSAFCDTFVEVLAAFGGEPDPTAIGGLLDELDSTAPDALTDDVGTLTTAARSVLETGDFALFESEEFVAADEAVDGYMVDECGFETIEVTAIDYGFENVPESMDAGTVAVEFTNDGTEAHELAVMRINDGVTESLDELLALPEEEVGSKVTFVGGDFAMPGGSATTFLDLDPGQYAFICFVPVGATPENLPALESGEFEGGPPHFTQGMVAQFTVEG